MALASPQHLPALRALTAGGRVHPLTLSGPAGRARSREERLRGELRAVLADGIPARELLALEPMLGEYDGVEIAAAALKLLDRWRENATAVVVAAATAPAAPAGSSGGERMERGERKERGDRKERGERTERGTRPGAPRRGADFTKLYINAGTKDRVSPSDLVGAIANEAGISRDQIGKVELRDTHALVEIAGDVAGKVARAITGVTVKGRRLAARIDDDDALGRRELGARRRLPPATRRRPVAQRPPPPR